MATAVYMPRWGMIMEEGLIVEWLKTEGDAVTADEPLLIVESEKAANEVPSPVSGILRAIAVPAGQTVAVGKLLAVIAAPDEDESAVKALLAQTSPPAAAAPASAAAPPPDAPSSPASGKSRRVKISPAAKRIAADKGINWKTLTGSGPGGRIERKDVLQAVEAAQTAPKSGKSIPLSQMRKAIARSTLQSIQAPQAALCREIDITALLTFRKTLTGREWPDKKPPTVTAIMIKAAAMALEAAPILNARLEGESIWLDDDVHIGVVIAVEGGIVVPVIRRVNKKMLPEIAAELKSLTQRARAGKLNSAEMEGGTFTISNAGPLGIDFFQALLYPPQVGALGLGRGRQRAVMINGGIFARTMAYFCVSSDHRVVDAEPIGRFLKRIEQIMQQPEQLIQSAS